MLIVKGGKNTENCLNGSNVTPGYKVSDLLVCPSCRTTLLVNRPFLGINEVGEPFSGWHCVGPREAQLSAFFGRKAAQSREHHS